MSKDKNYDYTAKERKQQERERMKELGFKRKEYPLELPRGAIPRTPHSPKK